MSIDTSPRSKRPSASRWIACAVLCAFAPGTARADEEVPGHVMGIGTQFAVVDSPYLNVTLDSSVSIAASIESRPSMVMLETRAASAPTTASLTIGGLQPSTTMHRYLDGFVDHVELTTDAAGTWTFALELSAAHTVMIQPTPSTIHIDATGGDAGVIGVWDQATKTCTLTTDVFQTISLDGDGITLDGAGHTVSAPGRVAISAARRTGCTIKNLQITDSTHGILVNRAVECVISDNVCSSVTGRGILGDYSSACVYVGNTVTNTGTYGIAMANPTGCSIIDNVVAHTGGQNINVAGGSACTLTGNTLSYSNRGIEAGGATGCMITGNTFSHHDLMHLQLGNWWIYGPADDCTVSRNNFLDSTPISQWYAGVHLIDSNYFWNYSGLDTNDNGVGDTDLPWYGDTSPFMAPDGWTLDNDGDGLLDYVETNTGVFVSALDTGTWRFAPDTDGDGLSDGDEVHTYPTDPLDADTDDDGLLDGEEIDMQQMGCPDPMVTDTDGDGLSDGYELSLGLDLCLDADWDGDGLMDGLEFMVYHTDPFDADSDNDGLLDGTEVDMAQGSGCPNPNAADSDGDTLLDGYEAGVSFTNPCSTDTDADTVPDNVDDEPTTPGVSSGFIEDALRSLCADISELPLASFAAPNNNARGGRRNALCNKISAAANAVADGDFQDAWDQLQSVLQKLDDQDQPPDWMVPGSAKTAVRGDAEYAAYLISFEL